MSEDSSFFNFLGMPAKRKAPLFVTGVLTIDGWDR